MILVLIGLWKEQSIGFIFVIVSSMGLHLL